MKGSFWKNVLDAFAQRCWSMDHYDSTFYFEDGEKL
jgi:hypothetical protein